MDALRALGDAASAFIPAQALIVAFFTFKGGVGKTTLCNLLAYILAKLGFNILLIDADRQCNLTLHFQDNPKLEKLDTTEDEKASSSDDDDDEAANLHGALQAGARKFYQKLLEQQASGNIRIPSIEGDALPPDDKLNPMTSDYLIPSEDDFDDIVGAVSDFISGKPRDLKLRQVQAGIYNESNQTGTLHLLKGSKDLASLEKDFHSQGSNKWQAMAAFRQMALHAAKQVGAQFVLVDMGPSTDDVNRTLATSADVIQPCACPDSYSWSGAMRLFTDVMPAWMGWWSQHRFSERQSRTDHNYNKTFPRIMPFMAMQYEWDSRGRVINWSDSNFICSIRDGFNELKSLLEGDGYRLKSGGDDSVLHMEDVWQDHLKDKMQEEGYQKMLEVIVQNKFVQCGEGQVIVPLLRNFKHMAMCHELGMAMFDITKDAIKDFLYEPGSKLPKDAAGKIRSRYDAVRKEAQVMRDRMVPLGHAYIALLVEHGQGSNQMKKGKKRSNKLDQREAKANKKANGHRTSCEELLTDNKAS